MHQLGLTKTIFFSDDGVETADYLKLAGSDAEGQYASAIGSHALTDTQTQALAAFKTEFESTFSVKYTDYDPYQPAGYDAAMLILNALSSVAKTDSSGNLTIDREALIKAIRATSGYVGLTGTLTCDSKGECGTGTVTVYQVKNGQWVGVQTYSGDDLKAAAGSSSSATMAATMAAGATMAPTMAMGATMAPTMAAGATMAPTMAATVAATKS